MCVVRRARFLLSEQAMEGRINKSEAASSSSYYYYTQSFPSALCCCLSGPPALGLAAAPFDTGPKGGGSPIQNLCCCCFTMSCLACGPYLQYASMSHPSCLLACWSLSPPLFYTQAHRQGRPACPPWPLPPAQRQGKPRAGASCCLVEPVRHLTDGWREGKTAMCLNNQGGLPLARSRYALAMVVMVSWVRVTSDGDGGGGASLDGAWTMYMDSLPPAAAAASAIHYYALPSNQAALACPTAAPSSVSRCRLLSRSLAHSCCTLRGARWYEEEDAPLLLLPPARWSALRTSEALVRHWCSEHHRR